MNAVTGLSGWKRPSVWILLLSSVILFAGGTVWAVYARQIQINFLVEIGFSVGGFLVALAYAQLRRQQEQRNLANETIALIARFAAGNRGSQEERDVLDQIVKYAQDQVRRSPIKERTTTLKTLLQQMDTHWNEAFPSLAKCPGFDKAWDTYFALRRNITSAIDECRDLSRVVDELEGVVNGGETGSKLGYRNANIPDRAQRAWRPLQAAILRRDEAASAIPSLETLPFIGEKADNEGRLANFWHLFDVATTDMRQAYVVLFAVMERTARDQNDDIDLCQRTLGACLERIRNCVLTLEFTQDDVSEASEGNTTISNKDLNDLVLMAKRIERGQVSERLRILPANIGVMIRDLDTAYKALQPSRRN